MRRSISWPSSVLFIVQAWLNNLMTGLSKVRLKSTNKVKAVMALKLCVAVVLTCSADKFLHVYMMVANIFDKQDIY